MPQATAEKDLKVALHHVVAHVASKGKYDQHVSARSEQCILSDEKLNGLPCAAARRGRASVRNLRFLPSSAAVGFSFCFRGRDAICVEAKQWQAWQRVAI